MYRRFIFVALAGVILTGWYIRYRTIERTCDVGEGLETVTIQAEGMNVLAEIAYEGADKVRGLSGRNCLDTDAGMLFWYEYPGDYCFWMKDMKFSIDMVWLDDEKRIVTIKDDVSPATYPQEFCPDKPAQFVVEIPAGKAHEYGWSVGTVLSF